MNRRTLLTRLAMMFIALVALLAVPDRASAEPLAPCCNAYTIDIDCSIDPKCFPIKINTVWANGLSWSSSYTQCGTFVEAPSTPPFPQCYVIAANFKYLTINGDPTIVVLNQPTVVNIGNCCYMVSCTADANGCLYIKIARC